MGEARRSFLSGAVLLLLVLGGVSCRASKPDVVSGTSATTAATTRPVAESTTIPVVVTLPEDSRPHASAVPATADFDGAVTVQPTFDLAASEIVAAVERRLPGEESPLRTESARGATGTTGTVLVRRVGFADDSVAGFQYDVTVEQGSQGWTVVSATKSAVCYRGASGELCI